MKYKYEDEEDKIVGMTKLSLYDLMAEELDVWVAASKTTKYGYALQIFDENGKKIIDEEKIHPAAMESYAAMCRRFIHFYEKAREKMEERL